jgi:molecular chaperone GrpE
MTTPEADETTAPLSEGSGAAAPDTPADDLGPGQRAAREEACDTGDDGAPYEADGADEAGEADEGRHGGPGDDAQGAAEQDAPTPPPYDPREERIKGLTRALESSEAQLHDYIKAHKKAKAEWEAYRLRLRRDQEAQVEVARGKVVERFLDVADNLERSLEAAGADTATLASLRDGMGLIHRQFTQALEGLGLERHDPTGEAFDPNSMEALGVVPVTDPSQDGKVVSCIKAGFRLGDRELRPALVQVGRKLS